MIDPDIALRAIRDAVGPLPAQRVRVEDCCGRVLAEHVFADCDLPAFDNSAMDGYALRAQDASGASEKSPARLRLSGSARAGGAGPTPVGAGEAVLIMTGAPMPQGADAVVPRERTRAAGGSVEVLEAPEPGQHVRARGLDVRSGERVLQAGTRLRPYEVALLAAQGLDSALVVRRPRVAVTVSGDELVPFRSKPGPGMVRDSNGPALRAALATWGCDPVDGGIARDDPEAMRTIFAAALNACDALLVSGGVSVGDYDHTRAVLESLGMKTIFWRARIKPGKPLLFGMYEGKPVFGLPGNPISSLVCCEVFARAALERLAGLEPEDPFSLRGRLSRPFIKPEGLRQYVFCSARRGEGGVLLEALEPQGSGLVGMGSRAQALAVAPIGVARLEAGAEVSFKWL